jgi:hypothetical protein
MWIPVRFVKSFIGNERGISLEIVQQRRAQFPSELMHDIDGFFHQPLRAGNLLVEALVLTRPPFSTLPVEH